MAAPARSAEQRKEDTLARLEHDVDAWIATADATTGNPYLVPLSFLWTGRVLLVGTPGSSVTSRNLLASGRARVAIGPTRDVVLVEAVAHLVEPTDDVAEAFVAKAGFDPRTLSGYVYFEIEPRRVQAWREANELPGRELMRDGRWLV
jgi:hypothetical protein